MQIIKIATSRLLKLEIPQLAKGVIEIVEKHDPKILLIEKAFNDFNLLKPKIESLIVRYGAHPLTERLEPVRQKRIWYATAISFQVRGLVKGYLNGTDNEIRVAKEAVNRYLLNLSSNNEEIINERVDQFLKETNTNAELQNAMEVLGFTAFIDDLSSANTQLLELLATRNASISKRSKGVLPVSSKAIRNGLSVLFVRITSATHDNKELNYNPLISELNERMIRFNGLIKMRETILKTSKEASSKEDGIVVVPNE